VLEEAEQVPAFEAQEAVMAARFKVHELLSREELDNLEAFCREPGRTVDEAHNWVMGLGYTLSRNAVWNWKKEFDATDKFRASNDVARSLVEAAKSGGTVAISDAATLQLSQMIFEQMLAMQSGEEVATKDLWAMSMALKNTISGARHVEKLRSEVASALAEASKEAKAGGSAEAVVNKVRQILGIKDAA
jgi:Protein of unknown function (DUF3486)